MGARVAISAAYPVGRANPAPTLRPSQLAPGWNGRHEDALDATSLATAREQLWRYHVINRSAVPEADLRRFLQGSGYTGKNLGTPSAVSIFSQPEALRTLLPQQALAQYFDRLERMDLPSKDYMGFHGVAWSWILGAFETTDLDAETKTDLLRLLLAKTFCIPPYQGGMNRAYYPLEYLGLRMGRICPTPLGPLSVGHIGALRQQLTEIRARFPSLFPPKE